MVKTLNLRRLFVLAAVLCLVLTALGARLVVLQVVRHDKFKRIAEWNTQSFHLREPRRGDILDVNADLKSHPEVVNTNPHGTWMSKVRLVNPGEARSLLESAQYQELTR